MYFTLSNGIKMPAVGIGTFMMSPEQAEEAVFTELAAKYKKTTAQIILR